MPFGTLLIFIYIGITRQQPLNAFKVSIAIERAIEKIGQHPFAFRECEEIPTKTKIYRKAICLSWLIIYKITSTEVIILAVIHSSRKPSMIKSAKKRN